MLMLIYVQTLSTGLILRNPPIARVNYFTNPISPAYNGLSNLFVPLQAICSSFPTVLLIDRHNRFADFQISAFLPKEMPPVLHSRFSFHQGLEFYIQVRR